MATDRTRVLADDRAMLAMLPPALATDYKLLIAQMGSETTAALRVQADVTVALLTSADAVRSVVAATQAGPMAVSVGRD